MNLREKALKNFIEAYRPTIIEREMYLMGMNDMCKIMEDNAYMVFNQTDGEVECVILGEDVAQGYIQDFNMNREADDAPLSMIKVTVLI